MLLPSNRQANHHFQVEDAGWVVRELPLDLARGAGLAGLCETATTFCQPSDSLECRDQSVHLERTILAVFWVDLQNLPVELLQFARV